MALNQLVFISNYVVAAPSALFLAVTRVLPESPRWLVSADRDAQALAVMDHLGDGGGDQVASGCGPSAWAVSRPGSLIRNHIA